LLLVGETGVGKSTLVNAFANYCKFSSLEEAVKAGGEFPIPCTFVTKNPETKEKIIVSSKGHVTPAAEPQQVGQSDTKMPSVYVFHYKNYEVNLIDTPGLNDAEATENPGVDKKHVTEILRLLSVYDEIHAICILLKATQTILSEATLTELFKLFNEGACDNVIFIFTCAGSTSFSPDAAEVILESFLNKNELRIHLTESTVYSFENGTMRYLVERKNGIPPNDRAVEDALRDWKDSESSTKAMLDYVCSLKPHSLSDMHAIHDVERKIGVLSKFVLETVMCFFKDRDDLEERKTHVEAMKNVKLEEKDLDKLSEVKETKVVCIELGYYNVVCGSCAEVVNGQTVYREPCCRNCGSIFMYFCSNMNLMAKCIRCGCDISKHEWVNFETEVVTETVKLPQLEVEPNKGKVNKPIVDSNALVDVIHSAICRRVEGCDTETEKMLRTCAQLNTIVRQNVLMSSSHDDELSKGLRHKIESITARGRAINVKELRYLETIESQYLKFLDEENKKRYSVEDMNKLMQELYRLPMKGKYLEDAMKEEEKARTNTIKITMAQANIPRVQDMVKAMELKT